MKKITKKESILSFLKNFDYSHFEKMSEPSPIAYETYLKSGGEKVVYWYFNKIYNLWMQGNYKRTIKETPDYYIGEYRGSDGEWCREYVFTPKENLSEQMGMFREMFIELLK